MPIIRIQAKNRIGVLLPSHRAKISKNVEIDAIKISIVNSLADQVNNFDINSLSSNAQETFKKINELCEDLETSKSHFTIQQSLHFENIVNKRLPQIIQEYIIIPEKYRKHLKHIEDSPDSLLEDSLKENSDNASRRLPSRRPGRSPRLRHC